MLGCGRVFCLKLEEGDRGVSLRPLWIAPAYPDLCRRRSFCAYHGGEVPNKATTKGWPSLISVSRETICHCGVVCAQLPGSGREGSERVTGLGNNAFKFPPIMWIISLNASNT